MIKEEKQRWLRDGGRELQYTFEGIGSDSVVFDIGLYKGKWSEEIAKRYDPHIYGFEPVTEFYRDAEKVLAKYPKVKLFNFGLGRNNRQAPIFFKTVNLKGAFDKDTVFDDDTDILFDGNAVSLVDEDVVFDKNATSPAKDNKMVQIVEIRSIKDAMPDFGRGFVDLASINIEGGEYELLDYMIGAGLIPKFGALLIQFHEIGDGYRYKRATIRTMLGLTHKEVYCYDMVWELWKKRK